MKINVCEIFLGKKKIKSLYKKSLISLVTAFYMISFG